APVADRGYGDYGVGVAAAVAVAVAVASASGVAAATGPCRRCPPRMRTRYARRVWLTRSYKPITRTCTPGCSAPTVTVTGPDMKSVEDDRVTYTSSPCQYGLCTPRPRATRSVTPSPCTACTRPTTRA